MSMQTIAFWDSLLEVGTGFWLLLSFLWDLTFYLSHRLDAFPSGNIRMFVVLKHLNFSRTRCFIWRAISQNSKINWTVLPTNPWMRCLKVPEPLNLFPNHFGTRQYPPISNSLQLLLIVCNLSPFLLFSMLTFPFLKRVLHSKFSSLTMNWAIIVLAWGYWRNSWTLNSGRAFIGHGHIEGVIYKNGLRGGWSWNFDPACTMDKTSTFTTLWLLILMICPWGKHGSKIKTAHFQSRWM